MNEQTEKIVDGKVGGLTAEVQASKPRALQSEQSADNRNTIAQYFSGNGTGMLMAHQRWRSATLWTRLITIAFGLLLIGLPGVMAWMENGNTSAGILEAITSRSDLLIPGVPMVVVGLMPWIWRFGWELPAGLLVLIFAGEMFQFQPDRPRMTIALLAFALAAIGYGGYLRWKRRGVPGNLKDLEHEVDAATKTVLQGAIKKALKEAPFPINDASASWQILRTIPDSDHLGGAEVQCLMGRNKRVRITPLGFAAFSLRADSMVVVQGAVDLTKAHVLFAHAQELAYTEIQGLEWTKTTPARETKRARETDEGTANERDASLGDGAGKAKSRSKVLAGIRTKLGRNAGPRHTDNVTIDLPRGRQIRLVFQDSDLLERKAAGGQIEDVKKIREVCGAVSERRRLALAKGGRREA